MECVGIDGSGFVYSTGEVAPACAEYALVTPVEFDRLTYFANLSEQLDPSGPVFWPVAGAMLTAYALVAGFRIVVRNLVLENSRN